MKILVLVPFTDAQKDRIIETAIGDEVTFKRLPDVTPELLEDKDAIIGNVNVPDLKYAKNLKWFQLNSAGANQYCPEGVLDKDVILTNAAGAYGTSVSEHMVAQTIAMVKNLNIYQDNQRAHNWKDEGHVYSYKELKIAVLGMGDIGTAYAKRMKALGSYIIGVRRSSTEHDENYDEAVLISELDKVLPEVDVTAIILPSTDATAGLFDETMLRKMKKGSFILNAGRGNIIDSQALIKVMNEGLLAGAALDVTDPEPLPADDPLWDAPRVWITPHIAGKFQINETLNRICDIACENLKHLKDGTELTHKVNRQNQY